MTDTPWLTSARAELRQRTELAATVYAALRATRKISSHRILTYRCPQRCMLLDVVNIPQGVILHMPGYSLPPTVNESTSTDAGRVVNTRDGDHRWNQRSYFSADCVNVTLNCDHVHQRILEMDDIESDIDAGHVQMKVSPTGARQRW